MTLTPRLIVGGDAGGANPPAPGSESPSDDLAPVAAGRILVWDVAVRVFHWTLVSCVLGAWLSGGSGHRIHEICGFVAAALLCFRLIWGIGGTRYARFAEFVRRPAGVRRYLGDILRNRASRHVGHNPAGGYMILLMLLCLAMISITGVMQLTGQFFGVAWVEAVHHYAGNALLAMVPVHVLGVILSSWMHQENLIGAMFRGTKAPGPDEAAVAPTAPEQMLMRVQGSQGLTVLMFLIGAGVLAGWTMTSHRTQTEVAEIPPTPTVEEISKAVQTSAATQAKDIQDYVSGGPDDASQTWLISSGGRLYDNWFKALGKAGPVATHKSWPASNTSVSGETTWRCKSCHGWDYSGRDGQYAAGTNATGIIGLQRMRGRDPEAIMAILGNTTHGFTDEILPQHAKYRLALFVSKGQHTATQYILASGKIRGDAAQGKPVFQSVCASCHGFDGRARKLGASSDSAPGGGSGVPLYVGSKATSGPTEVLHKIRNGHPGAIMVSMRPFGIEVAANLLAYAQTLPTK